VKMFVLVVASPGGCAGFATIPLRAEDAGAQGVWPNVGKVIVKQPGFAETQAFTADAYSTPVPLQLAPWRQSMRVCFVEHVEALHEFVHPWPVTAVCPGANLFVQATTALQASWHELLPHPPFERTPTAASRTPQKRFMTTSALFVESRRTTRHRRSSRMYAAETMVPRCKASEMWG